MPRPMHQALFFLIVAILWTALHIYVYLRVTRTLDLSQRLRSITKIGFFTFAILYLIARLLLGKVSYELGHMLLWPASLYLGFFSLGVSLLMFYDLIFTVPYMALQRLGIVQGQTLVKVMSRRALFAISILTLLLGSFGIANAWSGPQVRVVEVRLEKLPKALDGLRMVLVSDLHVGGLVTKDYFYRVLDILTALNPDVVVLNGDLSDEPDGGGVFELLGSLPVRIGVYAVTGNHEYYVGGLRTVEALERAKIRVLRQNHVVIANGLAIVGIDDPAYLSGRKNVPAAIQKALSRVPGDVPVILLSHQPLGIEQASEGGVDLMLCGHTHGGQIFPFHIISRLSYGVLTGEHRIGSMTLIISNGAGFWGPPMRLFAPADVVLVILRSGGVK